MTRLLACLVAAASVACAANRSAGPAAPRDGVPPLIDRALIFGDPEISGAKLSPDGKLLAFLRPFQGTRNIWVKGTDEPFEKARPVTAETKRPISEYFWSRDARYLLYTQDQGGDENFNVYAVDPAAAPVGNAAVPAARNLTDVKGARAVIQAVPRTSPDVIYVALNDRDPAWHDLYEVRISTGERKLLRKNTERITGSYFDTAGRLRVVSRVTEAGDTEVLRVDDRGLSRIYRCGVLESCEPDQIHPDDQRVYLETNSGADDLSRLVLVEIATGREEKVESDPAGKVDLGAARFSPWTDRLLYTEYDDERKRFVFHDAALEADWKRVSARFPGRDVSFSSPTRDERLWIVTVTADVEPGETFVYDRASKELKFQYRILERLPREHLATVKPVRYPSTDGLEIPGFLTLPKGVEAKALPVVVFPHGGPWYRDSWQYNRYAQFLANRGYAVLQPNFRGSTGYGKRFLDAGNRQWGDRMQDDLTAGAKYLVDQGIADPKRIGIMGGSYGGYATLAGVAFTPDLYAAGVDIVGPSNIITLLEAVPPYWEAGRKRFAVRVGDMTTPDGKAQLERQSPLFSAARIKTPLLVIQGANDPRVKRAEADQIVVALRDRGAPVEYIVAPDEGHGFGRPVNNMAAFAATEKFLAKHLGGRYQADMPAEVAQRLKEITVDPKSVTVK